LSTGFSINKTDHHDITEKLLKVALNTILHPLLASENLNKTKKKLVSTLCAKLYSKQVGSIKHHNPLTTTKL
jgi:hypothetical protein